MQRISRIVTLGMGVLGLVCGSVRAAEIGTAFTYQGRLARNGTPVVDDCDFVFTLFDDPVAGNQIGVPETFIGLDAASVVGGVFTIVLDFGEDVFDGSARFLEIEVACPAGGTLRTMRPRHTVRPVPYALALPGLRTQQNIISPNLIGGFSGNSVTSGVVGGTIGGGGKSVGTNRVTDDYGTVGGGESNQAGNDVGNTSDARYATVGGGRGKSAFKNATVGGGSLNTASGVQSTVSGGFINTAIGSSATVGGGSVNTASGSHATLGGGEANTASGAFATIGGGGTVAGGNGNTASGDSATIGGGVFNTASGIGATVGGGSDNTAGGTGATVGGGTQNTASGATATVPGGRLNSAGGDFSFAAGRRAEAKHHGAFVWADSDGNSPLPAKFTSQRNDQFSVRAHGGARFVMGARGLVAAKTWIGTPTLTPGRPARPRTVVAGLPAGKRRGCAYRVRATLSRYSRCLDTLGRRPPPALWRAFCGMELAAQRASSTFEATARTWPGPISPRPCPPEAARPTTHPGTCSS